MRAPRTCRSGAGPNHDSHRRRRLAVRAGRRGALSDSCEHRVGGRSYVANVTTPSATPAPVTPSPPTPKKLFTQTSAANVGSFSSQDWALFLAVAAIWGSSFLFIDIGLDAFPPGLITLHPRRLAVRRAGARSCSTSHGATESSRRTARRLLAALGALGGMPFTLFPIAEQHINSSVTGLLNGGTPIFAAIVGDGPARANRRKGPCSWASSSASSASC